MTDIPHAPRLQDQRAELARQTGKVHYLDMPQKPR